MRILSGIFLAAVLLTGLHQQVQAQNAPEPPPEGPIYIVNYIDAAPASVDRAIAALRQYRDAARQASGNNEAEIYQEIGRADRLAVTEIWADYAAFEANAAGMPMQRLRQTMEELTLAPMDIRRHIVFLAGAQQAWTPDALLVLTHVDVGPPSLPTLEEISPAFVTASRNDPGALRFDFVRQVDRRNHFTLIEGWANEAAFDAHNAAAHTREFRAAILPLIGALYDQRLYRRLP